MYKSIIPLALLLASCSYVPSVAPYKIDVQQGNVVTQEMVSKLKPGMSRSQARFIMGTPLISDVFHADRWDYVYRYQKGGAVTEERRITLIFENDALKRIEGDVVVAAPGEEQKSPAAQPEEAAPKAEVKREDQPAAAAAEDGKAAQKEGKGFFGRMLEKIGF